MTSHKFYKHTTCLTTVRNLCNVIGFVVNEGPQVAFYDGENAFNLKIQDNKLVVIRVTKLELEYWHEIPGGIVGRNFNKEIITWRGESVCHEWTNVFPSTYYYTGQGEYVHNSLELIFKGAHVVEAQHFGVHKSKDIRYGNTVTFIQKDKMVGAVDATCPSRQWREFEQKENKLTLKNVNNSTGDQIPRSVCGRFHQQKNGRHVCMGYSSETGCQEIYSFHDGNWTQLTEWNDIGTERILLSCNHSLSFRYKRGFGWTLHGLTVFKCI